MISLPPDPVVLPLSSLAEELTGLIQSEGSGEPWLVEAYSDWRSSLRIVRVLRSTPNDLFVRELETDPSGWDWSLQRLSIQAVKSAEQLSSDPRVALDQICARLRSSHDRQDFQHVFWQNDLVCKLLSEADVLFPREELVPFQIEPDQALQPPLSKRGRLVGVDLQAKRRSGFEGQACGYVDLRIDGGMNLLRSWSHLPRRSAEDPGFDWVLPADRDEVTWNINSSRLRGFPDVVYPNSIKLSVPGGKGLEVRCTVWILPEIPIFHDEPRFSAPLFEVSATPA